MAARTSSARLDLAEYLEVTRGVTVSFAYLLPLLTAYEVGILLTGSDLRNSAELSLKQIVGLFGVYAVWVQRAVLIGVLAVAARLFKAPKPALRCFPFLVLEAALFALVLGPVVSIFIQGVGLKLGPGGATAERLLLSIGAGVYEELVFRFLLLAGGFAFLHHGAGVARVPAFALALATSALLFSAYHHLGPFGEPFRPATFVFRAAAGVVLGLLFAWRGLALCAYLHAFYDILCDLSAGAGTS